MTIETNPASPPVPASEDQQTGSKVQDITWEWLHANIAKALRHVEPGSPLYLTAEVLTDELLITLKGAHHAA